MGLHILYLSLLFRKKQVSIVLVLREVGIFCTVFHVLVVLGENIKQLKDENFLLLWVISRDACAYFHVTDAFPFPFWLLVMER